MVTNTTGLNVVCVKWGDKYGPEFVNRLYAMTKKNLTVPFQFYCLTENPAGLSKNVNVIPFENPDLEMWWHKLNLFSKNLFKGTVLYFDLDTVIQNNIDILLTYNKQLTGVYTFWNDWRTADLPERPWFAWRTQFNSSVMVWKAEDYYWVWDKFNEDVDWHVIKYWGDDRFLGYEVPNKNTFPYGMIYCRLCGMTEYDRNGREMIRTGIVYRYPEALICMFNGPTTEEHYQGYEHYWS